MTTVLDPRAVVVDGSRVLADNGNADLVWGHLSVRDAAGRGIWIKRAGLGFEELTPDDVQLVGWDGGLIEGEGAVHVECHIHLETMRTRADVSAVVHSHAESAVVLGATGLPLLPIGHEGTFFTPPEVARFTRTGRLISTSELGRQVADELGDGNAILLVNHGVVVAESTVQRAVFGAVLLERAARMTLAAVAARGTVAGVHVSEPEEIAAKRATCYADRQVDHGWEYLVRTSRRVREGRSS